MHMRFYSSVKGDFPEISHFHMQAKTTCAIFGGAKLLHGHSFMFAKGCCQIHEPQGFNGIDISDPYCRDFLAPTVTNGVRNRL